LSAELTKNALLQTAFWVILSTQIIIKLRTFMDIVGFS